MTAWNTKANDIFLAALEIESPDQRAAYVEAACNGQAGLNEQVQALLTAHGNAGGFLESPPSAVAVAVAGREVTEDFRPIAEATGSRIGPYKLLQQIGEGGFGVVYMA